MIKLTGVWTTSHRCSEIFNITKHISCLHSFWLFKKQYMLPGGSKIWILITKYTVCMTLTFSFIHILFIKTSINSNSKSCWWSRSGRYQADTALKGVLIAGVYCWWTKYIPFYSLGMVKEHCSLSYNILLIYKFCSYLNKGSGKIFNFIPPGYHDSLNF